MKKLLTFGHVFVNSLINPHYYQKLVSVKSWFSWQYFLFLNFLLSFVVLLPMVPALMAFEIAPVARQTVEAFPQGVVISGDATGLHINQELPYSIPFPPFMQEAADQELPENTSLDINGVPYDQAVEFNLVTFTTDEAIENIQDFYATKSLIVVTDTTVYMLKDAESGEVRVYGMPSFDEAFSVSRDDVQNFADQILAHQFFAQKWYVPLIGAVAVLLTLPLSIWLRTIAVAFYSLFTWVIVAFFMKDKKLSYGKLFQLGLHSLTLPLLAKIVLDYFQWTHLAGFWFMVAYLVWTVFLISNVTTHEVASAHAVKSSKSRHTPLKSSTSKKTKK